MPKKPVTTQALTKYDEKFAELAKKAQKMEAGVGGGGNFISFRGGVMTYQGAQVPGNKMNVIIIALTLENQYYDKPFSNDSPASPVCYAFGEEQKSMVPHEACKDPQSSSCSTCDWNKMGSADRGKGKACANVHRIALITEGDMDDIENAEVAYAKLSYYSTIEYKNYVNLITETYHKPLSVVVTELSLVPDPKSQFRAKFKLMSEIENEDGLWDILLAKAEATEKIIGFPYPEFDDEEPAPKAKPSKVKRAGKKEPPAAEPESVAAGATGKPVKVGLRRPVKASRY